MRTGILVGKGQRPVVLDLRYANRHGLIAGATGTGKTVSMQVMAEGFARQGIPVVLSDVKGDLTGMAFPGRPHPEVDRRVQHVGIQDFRFEGVPVVPWDVLGEEGHPLRATVSDLGPLLLARLLDLNATQTGVLEVAFALADDEGLLLLDLKDLRALLQYMGDQRRRLQETYGMLHPSTLAALQRRLLNLEREGGDRFFGEPALDIQDWLKPLPGGQAPVHLLVARRLLEQPRLYATFLLWLLSELFEELPEVGDTERPRLVFFFDEAHLLFDGAPRALVEKVEQVVKLIRSRGVGLFFVTQNPLDLPEGVLAQLGNRVQHALRAYTPRERRAVRAAARSFRENPAMDTEAAITQLAVGEALVSFLEEGGVPGVVERALIAPPRSRIGAATPEEWNRVLAHSPFRGVYDTPVDRVSAYERLQMRATRTSTRIPERTPRRSPAPRRRSRRASTRRSSRRRRQSAGEAFLKSMLRGVGYTLGRRIVRGILGSILRGR